MAVYAIGDVQGCQPALLALLEALRFDGAVDRLWLTGDLVARGPDSLGSLRSVRAMGDAVRVVLGNHDLHLLAMAAGVRPLPDEPGLRAVLAAADRDDLLDWLIRQPLLHHDPQLDCTLVHAGIAPGWDLATAVAEAGNVQQALQSRPRETLAAMYGDEPRCWHAGREGMDRVRFAINAFTRMRLVDRDGCLVPGKGGPESAPRGSMPWFLHPALETFTGRIAFGHWSTLGLRVEGRFLALDGGCVWGGRLCAVRLDDARAEPVTVDCTGLRPPPRGPA
ncbi:MAG: symmetrical bis(5'-nucleosyl)-tetraphosphatase [Steroidobacteraceae bacterium]